MMEDRTVALGFTPQKELVYHKLLPYSDKLDRDSNVQLAEIKTNLARAVLLQDIRPGCTYWVHRLSEYIGLYGRKLSLEDHITFIKLLYELVTAPDLEFTILQNFAQVLAILLKKRSLITPDQLELPWRPLYKLYETVAYSPYETLGLVLFPGQDAENLNTVLLLLQELGLMKTWTSNLMARCEGKRSLQTSVKSLIRACRPYFPLTATQEMLDEWRPLLCPFDVSITKGTSYFELFLPTLLPPEHHDKGFKLWFTEFINLWEVAQNVPAWESSLVWLFARLATENIGYIDWEPYIPTIFTKLLRSLNLPVGPNKIQGGRNGGFEVAAGIHFVTALLGGGSNCQKYLTKFFKSVETYYHPSNHGRWTIKLHKLLVKLPAAVAKRLHRERVKSPTWETQIPSSHLLTDTDITEFVKCMTHCVFLSMFSKTGPLHSAQAMQYLSSLRPELIIPPLLERLYPALETLTEPHRLIAALHCIVSVSRSLVRESEHYPDGPSHVVPLLMCSLPGIDPNDFKKSMVTFQFIFAFVTLVPLVDCSAAVSERSDLNEREQEVCLATRQLEDFVLQFMDRCFAMIESSSLELTTKLDRDMEKMNSEEGMVEVVLTSTFTTILMQCSSSIFKAVLMKLRSFILGRVLETVVSGKLAANMCRAVAKANPELALQTFLPHLGRIILNLTTAEEVQTDEELDSELLYNLLVLSELIRTNGRYLLPYKELLVEVLNRTIHLKSKRGYLLAGSVLRHMMKALTFVAPNEFRSKPGGFDKPVKEYLVIRDWGMPGDVDNMDLDWHVMTAEEKTWVQELLEMYLVPELKKIEMFCSKEYKMTREELQTSLSITWDILLGAGAALPLVKEKPLSFVDSKVSLSITPHVYSTEPDGVTLADGRNVRQTIGAVLHKLVAYSLETSEDDTKSFFQIIQIYQNLLFHFGVNKKDFENRWKSFQFAKKSMENKLLGKKQHIRSLLIDRTQMQHEMFVLASLSFGYSEFHHGILEDLVTLGTSHYSEVRTKAQDVIHQAFRVYPRVYIPFVPRLALLLQDKSEVSHEQFKGALYILLGAKNRSFMTSHNWEILNVLWPALVEAQHSEKPSIVRLIDAASDLLLKNLESASISFEIPEQCLETARQMWNGTEPAPCKEIPTEKEFSGAQLSVKLQNEENKKSYNCLVEKLVGLAQAGHLRWRHYNLTLVMLTLLIRYDIHLPACAVKLFVNNLIHEAIRVRKMSISAVGAILKQQKRKHSKVVINPYAILEDGTLSSNNVNGNLLKICPGERPDNSWLQYSSKFRPEKADDWENKTFVEKTHFGYYNWPLNMEVYAKHAEQPPLERSRDELSPEEAQLYDFFCEESNVNQWIKFLCLEERKGKDKFDAKRFVLFKGLFRNFGNTFLPVFTSHLPKLVADSHESSQRCAAEIIAGVIRGSKHWPFPMVAEMKGFLEPVLRVAMCKVTVETVADWGTCVATSSENGDPNRLYWLLELLMEDPMRSEEGSFIESSRLYALQGGLAQQEWRVAELLHRLLDYLQPILKHPYQNVRLRLGSVLTNIFLMDIDFPGGTKTKNPRREEFVKQIRSQLEILESEIESRISRSKSFSTNDIEMDSVDGAGKVNGEVALTNNFHPEDEKMKTAVALMKTMCKWMTGNISRGMYTVPAEFFQFLPMICQLESNDQDEELKQDCMVTLAYLSQGYLTPPNIQVAIDTVTQISQSLSWRARASCLSYLQVMVFSNLFLVMHNPVWVNSISELVLNLLDDERVEVREMASVTLGGLLQCEFIRYTDELQRKFVKKCSQPLRKSRKEPILPEAVIQRHAGILGLSSYVNAYPYDVPEKVPDILMILGEHLNDPQPIPLTVKKTLSNFRRTHHDSWRDHKKLFSDDQLAVLTDLLVSPSYYA